MRAYSIDLRDRVIKAADAGLPKSVVARTFQVSRATVSNYLTLRRDTGDLKSRPSGGDRRSKITAKEYPALLDQLQTTPDATLAEHCEAWESSHGAPVSIYAMHRAILRTGWTRKKRHSGRLNKTLSRASSGARR